MDSSVLFTRLDESEPADFDIIRAKLAREHEQLADRVLDQMRHLQDADPGPQLDRLSHCLQTATRAQRDGADEETVVCAVLHDMANGLTTVNHGAIVAELLKPYVSPNNYWMVRHHPVFQGYYHFHHFGKDRNARDKHRGHPAFAQTLAFVERWDQLAFDPAYDTLPLEAFAPLVRRLFARPPKLDD